MKVLLELQNIRKAYGPQVILNNVNVAISEDQKIGVIGRNGAGKSTLCKIITGHETHDSGTMRTASDYRLAYLEQHDPFALDETVIGFLQRYTGKEAWQCAKIGARFQLKNELLESEVGTLSGGYRTRVKLASMLLRDPNFLVLDEPTNYLDLKTLILLEEFLQDYHGGFLLVSHDREFLKKTCGQTLEIERGECKLFPGNVEEFLVFKDEQRQQAMSYNKNIEAKQKQLQEFVNRFRAKASKASQARSKMKQIERLKTIDIDHPLGNVRIRIPKVNCGNAVALRCEGLAIGYPDHTVARHINMEIDQGAHVAVLGDNGQGKTTLLRTIAADLEAISGSCRWGYGLGVGYYAQHVCSDLDPEQDVHGHLTTMADSSVTRQEILNLAGSFLFRGDDVKKKVAVLSGGEKARLCLAGLLLTKRRVLIMDEPTNHLDFETVEALGTALKGFQGTLFFVSHDRTFVNMLATQIVEVKDGAVVRYPGPFEEYVYDMEKKLRDELKADVAEEAPGSGKKKMDRRAAKKRKGDRTILVSEIRKLEKEFERHNAEREQIHQEFMSAESAYTNERNRRYEYLADAIRGEEDLLLELNLKLEELESAE